MPKGRKPNPVKSESTGEQTTILIRGDLNLKLQAVSVVQKKPIDKLVAESLESMISQLAKPDQEMIENLVEFSRKMAEK